MVWKKYKLSEIGTVVGGATPSTTVERFYGGDIPWLTPKDLSNFQDRYIEKGERNITQEGLDSCSAQLLPANTVLFSSRAPIGYVAIAKNPIATNQGFKSIIPNERVDSLFLYYILRYNKERIEAMGSGTTFKEVSGAVMKNVEISLPSLEEQRRIAGILGAIDDKIENNRRINANLEHQAQALYKQWFVDFEFPNEEGKPYKSSGGKMVDSDLGPIPDGWSVGDIYKYVNVVYGAPYKSALFNERKDGNPLIRIRDLKTFSPQYYTQEILPNTEFITAGDIVAGMDAEFVPCLWMGEKGVLNQRCCKFAGKQDSISNYYVMFLVKPELEFVQSYKTGTTVSHLGKADIDKFVVVQPPLTVIEKFSKIANALLNNKIKLAKENITLATLRDTLLPKLMNGEIKTE